MRHPPFFDRLHLLRRRFFPAKQARTVRADRHAWLYPSRCENRARRGSERARRNHAAAVVAMLGVVIKTLFLIARSLLLSAPPLSPWLSAIVESLRSTVYIEPS